MTSSSISFFDGKPVVLEVDKEKHVLNSVSYEYKNGEFYLLTFHGMNPSVYGDVLYEDIDTSKDGRIEFEYQGSPRVIRKFEPADGLWATRQKMEMKPEMIEGIRERGEMERESVQALVSDDSDEVVGFIFDVPNLGIFFRMNGEWDYPTPDMLDILETSNSLKIRDEDAKNVISKWDKSKKMKLSDVQKYVEEEDDEE